MTLKSKNDMKNSVVLTIIVITFWGFADGKPTTASKNLAAHILAHTSYYHKLRISFRFDDNDSLYGFMLFAPPFAPVPDDAFMEVGRNELKPMIGALGITFGCSEEQAIEILGKPSQRSKFPHYETITQYFTTILTWDNADSDISIHFYSDSAYLISSKNHPVEMPFSFAWRAHKSEVIKALGPSTDSEKSYHVLLPLLITFILGSFILIWASRKKRGNIFWTQTIIWLTGWVVIAIKLLPTMFFFSRKQLTGEIIIWLDNNVVQAILSIIVFLCGLVYMMLFLINRPKRIYTVVFWFIAGIAFLGVLFLIGFLSQDPMMGVFVFSHGFVFTICFLISYIICRRGWLFGFILAAIFLGIFGNLRYGDASIPEAILWAILYYLTVLIIGIAGGYLGQYMCKAGVREKET